MLFFNFFVRVEIFSLVIFGMRKISKIKSELVAEKVLGG